jgi:hypothetical protein
VPDKLIAYPNTKWRMIYDVLLYYASTPLADERQMLFKIIEEVVHPLLYDGDEQAALEVQKTFNKFLKYDDFQLDDGLLYQKVETEAGIDWVDKEGLIAEPKAESIFPKDITGLYIFWNELIKLTKFYLKNKDNQDDELNGIYFSLIERIEETLQQGHCGAELRKQYKRPFKNLVGCEFEARKNKETEDDIISNLYDFLGRLTSISLPNDNDAKQIKEKNADLLNRIEQYITAHAPPPAAIHSVAQSQEPIPIKIVGETVIALRNAGQKKNKDKPDNTFPHKLPAGTQWENITMQFLDQNQAAISVRGLKHSTDFIGMGFMDDRTKKPNQQWALLRILAQQGGEIARKDPDAKDQFKKTKENLAKGLQHYFTLDYDPFYPYNPQLPNKTERSYKIKMTLIPESAAKITEKVIEPDLPDTSESIEAFFNEQSPQLYDESSG